MKKQRRLMNGGFTLIELLLVISIILILVGFLVPKFSSYENKAKSTKAVNTAKQLQTAAMASYGDDDGKFVKDDVQDCLSKLTSADSPQVLDSGIDDDNVGIKYKSDNKDYTIYINAKENTYTVKDKDGLQVYPKVIK
ncbi:type IV pilus assembly protein PilA [Clostridium algifaecis]|uniref:Type IV pilus assembly protein PilA n=1 Tax=Clostridium algifaecis TaxID=1472040 RepID=A0ABS4KN48_9CLOT|nr:prepilin-type N-terminal cleavage/methylation domain-containing protein [Clostridium algifaecis]MBP2031456.1 type IV pilus assembly protein PilA [Clostridium algifaecis]